MTEVEPWMAYALALLPLAGCTGLLLAVVLGERIPWFFQFVKYGANGVMATYVQTGTFYLLGATCLMCLGPDDWAVKFLGLPSAEVSDGVRAFRFSTATAAGFVVANVFCWLMNRWCVFFAASTLATAIALGLSAALIRLAGLMTTIALAIEIVVSFFVNFFMRKFFIFKG